MVPITLIGVAISTAAFPQLSQRLSQNRPDLFKKDLTAVMRTIIWLVLPTTVIAYFGRGYLVRLLVADGDPTISALLGMLVVAIAFRSIFHLLTRSYYAQQDTKTPLYISLVAIGLNIVLAVYLAQPTRYGILGLALAQSISAMVEATLLVTVLVTRVQGLITSDLLSGLYRMVAATGLSGFITYVMIAFVLPLQASDVGFFALVPKFATVVLISLTSYTLLSYLFRVRESYPVVEKTKQFILGTIRL
jgi:putative peptidoglycan lipid II flippase